VPLLNVVNGTVLRNQGEALLWVVLATILVVAGATSAVAAAFQPADDGVALAAPSA
jgi:hypothetical protein